MKNIGVSLIGQNEPHLGDIACIKMTRFAISWQETISVRIKVNLVAVQALQQVAMLMSIDATRCPKISC